VVIPKLADALNLEPSDLFEDGPESLELLRRAAGLSLMELGDGTGLGYKRVRRIERGLTSAVADDIARLASTLGVTQQRVRAAAQAAAATRKNAASAGP
jgi:transcriptional regulator with XRE-family HTH domain